MFCSPLPIVIVCYVNIIENLLPRGFVESLMWSQVMVSVNVALLSVFVLPHPLHAENVQL